MNKRVTKGVIGFIVVLHSLAFFTGCSDRQPARVEWISIEKPPLRLIYVSQKPIADETVHHLLQHVEKQPYKNYKFNEGIKIELSANAHQSDTESDSDITSTTINK